MRNYDNFRIRFWLILSVATPTNKQLTHGILLCVRPPEAEKSNRIQFKIKQIKINHKIENARI